MKANIKSAGMVQSLLLNHGEKIGMLVVVALAGWLLYGSLSPEGESRNPSELGTLVSQAQRQLSEFTAADARQTDDPENKLLEADKFTAVAAEPIDPGQYDTSDPWGTSPGPPTVLRTDPTLLAAEDLEGYGYTALIATIDEETRRQRREDELRRDQELERARERSTDSRPGGIEDDTRRAIDYSGRRRQVGVSTSGDERIDLASFAAVTALVPVKDQYMQYRDALENALGYQASKDVPHWLGYLIERTEVTSDGQEKWTRIRVPDHTSNGRSRPNVSQETIALATSDWVQGMEPLMDRRYFHPELTFPLPPLVGKNFDRKVVHSQVPLQAETEALNQDLLTEQEAGLPDNNEDPDALLLGGGGDQGAGRGMVMPGYGSRMGRESFGSGGGGYDAEDEYGSPMGGGMMGGGMMGGDFTISEPYAMLRFFDFTVQPGKRYRYRVRLILIDVNAKDLVIANHLSREVRARIADQKVDGSIKYRISDWSEPSKIISIPSAGEVLLADVKPAPTRSPNGEPTANLLVKSYDVTAEHRARQGERILTFRRGAVINRTEDDVWILDPEGRGLVKVETFPFKTNATLLDIQGGAKVNRDTTEPGKVLLMDVSGRLMVTDKLSSLADVEYYRNVYEQTDNKKQGGSSPYESGDGGDFFGF